MLISVCYVFIRLGSSCQRLTIRQSNKIQARKKLMPNFRISRYWELNLYFLFSFCPFSFLFSLLSHIFPFSLSNFLLNLQFFTLFSLFLQFLFHPLIQIVFSSLFFILLIYPYMSNTLLSFVFVSLFLSFGVRAPGWPGPPHPCGF